MPSRRRSATPNPDGRERKIKLPGVLIQKLISDPRISVEECAMNMIDAEQSSLGPAEQAAIGHAAPKRIREFAAGRILARRALTRLGLNNIEIPARPDRAPAWPDGIIGSITHTSSWCAAAVARQRDYASIGIDVENLGCLEEPLWEQVLTFAERQNLNRVRSDDKGLFALLIFSAKEAVFKAQYLLTERFLDFHDVEITLNLSGACFDASLAVDKTPAIPSGYTLKGYFLHDGTYVATAVTIKENLQAST